MSDVASAEGQENNDKDNNARVQACKAKDAAEDAAEKAPAKGDKSAKAADKTEDKTEQQAFVACVSGGAPETPDTSDTSDK